MNIVLMNLDDVGYGDFSCNGAPGPETKTGVHEDEMTIAEVLKQKDYATAIYGKWHLGSYEQFLSLR